MAGADQSKPEFRAASIKGNMRFIWRAVQRAENIEELRECEGKLFGNAFGGKDTKASDMRIRIENATDIKGRQNMAPHRGLNEYEGVNKQRHITPQAFQEGNKFDVVITSFVVEEQHKNYVRLFVLTCLLYGFGRRSRKGFGTVEITGIELIGENEIDYSLYGMADNLNAISKFGAKYSFIDGDNPEITVEGGGSEKYPYIENIRIAGTIDALGKPGTKYFIEQIGLTAHDFNNGYSFLGGSKNRFASSVLLSTIPWGEENFRCIVTQLYCTQNLSEAERKRFYDELDGRV